MIRLQPKLAYVFIHKRPSKGLKYKKFFIPVKLHQHETASTFAMLNTGSAVSIIPYTMKHEVEIVETVGPCHIKRLAPSLFIKKKFDLCKVALYFDDPDLFENGKSIIHAAIPRNKNYKVHFTIGMADFIDHYKLIIDCKKNVHIVQRSQLI